MKTILLAAIGITIAVMLLREPPPPAPAPVPLPPQTPKAAVSAVPQSMPKPVASAPRPKLEVKRIPGPPPEPAPPLAVKGVPEVEPELIPAAAVTVVTPAPAAAPVQPAAPNSVYGWGGWAASQPIGGGGGASSSTPSARTETPGPTIAVAASRNTTSGSVVPTGLSSPPVVLPPVVLPPPQLGAIKPGHGFGDSNHVHQHKHHPRR